MLEAIRCPMQIVKGSKARHKRLEGAFFYLLPFFLYLFFSTLILICQSLMSKVERGQMRHWQRSFHYHLNTESHMHIGSFCIGPHLALLDIQQYNRKIKGITNGFGTNLIKILNNFNYDQVCKLSVSVTEPSLQFTFFLCGIILDKFGKFFCLRQQFQ